MQTHAWRMHHKWSSNQSHKCETNVSIESPSSATREKTRVRVKHQFIPLSDVSVFHVVFFCGFCCLVYFPFRDGVATTYDECNIIYMICYMMFHVVYIYVVCSDV